MGKITFSMLEKHKMQIIKDALAWAATFGIEDKQKLNAYEAGLSQGMTSLIQILKLKNVIEVIEVTKAVKEN